MRLRRPFALVQFILIGLILFLAKRSRDRHYTYEFPPDHHGDDGIINDVILAEPDGNLFMDNDNGIRQEQEEVGELFESVSNKRDNIFEEQQVPPSGGEEQQPLAEPIILEQAEPVQPEQQQIYAQEQQVPPPPAPDDANELSAQQVALNSLSPSNTSDAPTAYAEDTTFHFPMPGEELDLGDLADTQNLLPLSQDVPGGEGVPSNIEAPGVTLDENGLEVIPRADEFVSIDPSRFSLDVSEEDINRFRLKFPPLLENYKNPCWLEEIPDSYNYDDSYFNTCHYVPHTNKLKHEVQYKAMEKILTNRTTHGLKTRMRCFPYFFLIGVGKSGTTDVYDTLKKYFSDMAPVFLKEPHYWEWKRCIDKLMCRGTHRTPKFSEYMDSFDAASDYIESKTITQEDGTIYHNAVLGDFTPSVLAFHPCWRLMPGNEGLQEPRYINAHYIRAIRPQTKFIAIMRDPVERIFSNFRMRDRMSKTPSHADAEMFHTEMTNVIEYLRSCMEIRSDRACTYSIQKFDFGTHVTNSMYEVYIRDWFKVFPRDQFLFLRMEDYMESRIRDFHQIVDFLDLEPLSPAMEMMIGAKAVANQAPPAAMFNETRTLLQDFFRPYNHRLAELLGNDGWTWGY